MLDSWPIRQLAGWTVGQLDAGHSGDTGDVLLCLHNNTKNRQSEKVLSLLFVILSECEGSVF